jgi:glycosyltransferase involved in cell wall biosynthesis
VRILHVIPSLDAGDGGPSKAVVEICLASQAFGDRVEIAATGLGPAPNEIPTHLFPRRGKLDYKFSPDLGRWLDANVKNYDVLHVHAVFHHSTHLAARAAKRAGVPYLVRPLGTLNDAYSLRQKAWKKRWYLRWIARKELDSAAALHCTSQPEAEDMRRLGLRAPKVVIPHGLRLEQFEHLPSRGAFRQKTGDTPVIVFFGRVHPKKGFDILLPALESLDKSASRHRDFQLLVAGPGDEAYIATLKAEAERRGIAGYITWAGMQTGDARLQPLVDADIFVLPSYNENWGIAVAEAMACGVPVLVSDQVDLCIEVREWRAGLVVACDVGELATAIARLLDDPALRSECGANGRRFVAQELPWGRVAGRLHDLYEAARRGKVDE